MIENHIEKFDLNQYRSINQNQSIMLNIIDIIDKDFKFTDRKVTTHYFSESVSEAWNYFCSVYPKRSKADLTEIALIYAMLTIPNKYALIDIDVPDKLVQQQSLDNKLQDMICVDKLEKFLERMKAINGKLRTNHKEDFLGILKECKKVNIRSDRLSQLLSEAMTYFE